MSASGSADPIDAPEQAPEARALPAPDQLTVYGADWCGDCRRAKRYLDAAGIAYRWVDLLRDETAQAVIDASGIRSIPVIVTPGGEVFIEPSNEELDRLVASLD
jgi:mycoredoxin